MSKRRGWNDNFAPREERKRPIEDDELRGLESLKPWELMSEEEYETSIIAEYNADEVNASE